MRSNCYFHFSIISHKFKYRICKWTSFHQTFSQINWMWFSNQLTPNISFHCGFVFVLNYSYIWNVFYKCFFLFVFCFFFSSCFQFNTQLQEKQAIFLYMKIFWFSRNKRKINSIHNYKLNSIECQLTLPKKTERRQQIQNHIISFSFLFFFLAHSS